MTNDTSATAPDDPADPQTAALELIMRLPIRDSRARVIVQKAHALGIGAAVLER